MDTPVIELQNVIKSFGPVDVLQGINFKAYAGRVTALVGDNGAGKSTVIKGLAGVQSYDSGVVKFEGNEVHLNSARQAAALGIEVVYQDLALCENLDIVQNMFLGREEMNGFTLDETNMEYEATQTLAGLKIRTVKSVRQKVASLSGGQRQTVAIARSVLRKAKLVILDVFKVCDDISVLYLGKMVAHLKATETNHLDVVGYITGTKSMEQA